MTVLLFCSLLLAQGYRQGVVLSIVHNCVEQCEKTFLKGSFLSSNQVKTVDYVGWYFIASNATSLC